MSRDAGPTGGAHGLLAGLYRLDPSHTFTTFSVKHAIVGRVGGRFNTIAGTFVVTRRRNENRPNRERRSDGDAA